MIRHNGHFKPNGTCGSTFGWAHLLYALDIRPGQGILRWRVPTSGKGTIESGSMALEIDGAILSHIINLYRIYHRPGPATIAELNDANPTYH